MCSSLQARETTQERTSWHMGPHNVCVTDCYFTVNVLNLPFASPINVRLLLGTANGELKILQNRPKNRF